MNGETGLTVKYVILQKLKENRSSCVSGEALGKMLGVSRTAVWKSIKELKKEGYVIESSPRKGYRLINTFDTLNVHEISCNPNTEIIGKNIRYFSVIDSTNTYAKKLASEGCDEGTVVIADYQTSGKGRLGREWISADRKGIRMSVVLRPSIAPEDVRIITLAASTAVVSAILESTGIKAGIKWPNDIILGTKKVCGILTEMNSEVEHVNFLVLGIGINVNQALEDFPEELRDIATSLMINSCGDRIQPDCSYCARIFNRSEIINRVLFELDRTYKKVINGHTSEVIDEWKKYTVTLGKEVRVIVKNNEYTGIAKDITHEGKLVVSCADGIAREVLSGEVSVRGLLEGELKSGY